MTHSQMVQTRRRRAAGKKQRERIAKLAQKPRRHGTRRHSGPAAGAALGK